MIGVVARLGSTAREIHAQEQVARVASVSGDYSGVKSSEDSDYLCGGGVVKEDRIHAEQLGFEIAPY